MRLNSGGKATQRPVFEAMSGQQIGIPELSDRQGKMDARAEERLQGYLCAMRKKIAEESRLSPDEIQLRVISVKRLICSCMVFTELASAIEKQHYKNNVIEEGYLSTDALDRAAQRWLKTTTEKEEFREGFARYSTKFGRDLYGNYLIGPGFCYRTICGSCGGTGEKNCYSCGTTGKSMCLICGGTGHTVDRNDQYRDHYAYTHNQCAHCGGTGYLECEVCGGAGKYTCSACGGSGYGEWITRTPVIKIKRKLAAPAREIDIPDDFWKLTAAGPVAEGARRADFESDFIEIHVEAQTPVGSKKTVALYSLDNGAARADLGEILDGYAEGEALKLAQELEGRDIGATIDRVLDLPRMRDIIAGKARGGKEARRFRKRFIRRCVNPQRLAWLKCCLPALAVTLVLLPQTPWMKKLAAGKFFDYPMLYVMTWLVVIVAWLIASVRAGMVSENIGKKLKFAETGIKSKWDKGGRAFKMILLGMLIYLFAGNFLGSWDWLMEFSGGMLNKALPLFTPLGFEK